VTARRLRPATDEAFDDAVQEGVIAGWTATREVERTEPTTYGKVAAKNRIVRVLSGRQGMTGSEREGSKTYDLHRQATRRGDLADVREPLRDPYVAADRRIDLERVLATLDARDRLIARAVACDRPWEEIAAFVGMKPRGVAVRWERYIRPVLRERLADY
jgi:RNA polymerase sigma factor (sigma-70 family)